MTKARDRDIRWGVGYVTRRGEKRQARWHDGERWRAKTFTSDDAAYDHLRAVSRAKRDGRYVPPQERTVAQIVEDWLTWGADRWNGNTASTYRQRADRFVLPAFGRMRVVELTTPRVQAWVDDLRRQGLSASTIDGAGRVLSGSYKDAVRLGLVDHNPMIGIRKPSIKQKTIPTWTSTEIARVIRVLVDDAYWFALYQFALATGVRPGELRALHWQEVNLVTGIAVIARTMTRDADGLVVMGETTKTGKARAVAIPAVCVASLQRWQTEQKRRRLAEAFWHDDDLVFDRGDGRWLPLTTWQHRHAALIELAGVKRITLHQLRHTAATLMLERGIHPKIVSEILGHRKIETTLNLYSHVSVTLQRDAVELMASALFNVSPDLAVTDADDGMSREAH